MSTVSVALNRADRRALRFAARTHRGLSVSNHIDAARDSNPDAQVVVVGHPAPDRKAD